MTVESAQGCSVPLWMWPWGRRGTSVRRKAAELLSQGLPVKAEVHLLPHPPMHDSEVANMCVQKTNLFCKVYSKKHAFKKWNLAGHQEIRCTVEGHQMKNLIISLGCEGTWDWVISHLLKKSIHLSKLKDRYPWGVNRKISMWIPNTGPGDTEVSPDCTGSALILSAHSDRKTCSFISWQKKKKWGKKRKKKMEPQKNKVIH